MFLGLIDAAGIPRPEINALLETYEVDAVFRDARLGIELDGRDTHGTVSAFESDRERDRALLVADWRVIRVTYRQMRDTPERLIADLRSLLASGGGRLAA